MRISNSKGLILQRRDSVKDDSEVITVLLENGNLLELFSQGSKKITSKNSFSLNEGTITNIEFFQSKNKNKMSRLKTARSVEIFDKLDPLYIEFIGSIADNLKEYNLGSKFYKNLMLFQKNKMNFNSENLVFLLNMIIVKVSNVVLYFRGCYICKRKNEIISFSYEGGLLCEEHSTNYPNFNKGAIKFLFDINFKNIDEINSNINFEDIKNIKQIQIEALKETLGIYLKI